MTDSAQSSPLLSVRNLKMHFPVHGGVFQRTVGYVHAVDDVSFDVQPGTTLGVVGESGCGKTTMGRCLLRLYQPTGGSIQFSGQDLLQLNHKQLRSMRQNIQMVFQDPYESLNARKTVGTIVEEPLKIFKQGNAAERKERVAMLLDRVGLPKGAEAKFPHEFSGGQRQRIGIARAIALQPKLIVCDEPVSALDVSIQSQVLNLLLELQDEMGLSYVFIAHDLAVVKHISDFLAVMYLGRIVEYAAAHDVYKRPLHPYTKALIKAIPIADPRIGHRKFHALTGEVPSPIHPPSGCHFHTRCPHATERCKAEEPAWRNVGEQGHFVACHYAEDLAVRS